MTKLPLSSSLRPRDMSKSNVGRIALTHLFNNDNPILQTLSKTGLAVKKLPQNSVTEIESVFELVHIQYHLSFHHLPQAIQKAQLSTGGLGGKVSYRSRGELSG